MLRSSLAVRTSNVTSGNAALEIIAPAAHGCFLKELDIILAAATASTYGLGRPAAKGITPTSPVALLSEFGGDATEPLTTTALAWGTGPTVPVAFFRRVGFPATIASRVLWQFAKNGLWIPAGGSLVLWNLATNGVLDVTVVIDEPER